MTALERALAVHALRVEDVELLVLTHHHDDHAGLAADVRARSVGVGGQHGALNAPTVFNAGFNFTQFWNGRAATLEEQSDIKYAVEWTTLGEYLGYLERSGISCNVASFIGAPTIREYVIGLEDKPPTPAQLDEMRELVRREMEAGALGITTALIYPPAFFAKTEELIELCKVAAKYQGKYTTHMRSEGNQLIEGVQETMRIGREAGLPVEIYHLKASGEANWPKMDQVIRMIEDARRQGLKISANMYTYPAGGTGLDAECLYVGR